MLVQVGNYIQTLWNEIRPEEEGVEVSEHMKFSPSISALATTMDCTQNESFHLVLIFCQCPCHLNGGVEAATTLAGALLSLLLR